jgi:hypothetical protein
MQKDSLLAPGMKTHSFGDRGPEFVQKMRIDFICAETAVSHSKWWLGQNDQDTRIQTLKFKERRKSLSDQTFVEESYSQTDDEEVTLVWYKTTNGG